MVMRAYQVNVTTGGGGGATVFSPRVSGRLHAIHYRKNPTTPFADGVDFTITKVNTGESLWTDTNVNATESVYPRVAVHDGAGNAVLYAAGGTPVRERFGLGADRVKIVIAQGGASKAGAFIIEVD